MLSLTIPPGPRQVQEPLTYRLAVCDALLILPSLYWCCHFPLSDAIVTHDLWAAIPCFYSNISEFGVYRITLGLQGTGTQRFGLFARLYLY